MQRREIPREDKTIYLFRPDLYILYIIKKKIF